MIVTGKRVIGHVAAWVAIYLLWLWATRAYHPTAALAMSATAVLIVASAAAVYVNRLVLIPRFARRGRWARYAAMLAGAIALLDLFAVIVIQLIYDVLWGLDPNRFGLGFNLASDGVIIGAHVAVAAAIVLSTRRES